MPLERRTCTKNWPLVRYPSTVGKWDTRQLSVFVVLPSGDFFTLPLVTCVCVCRYYSGSQVARDTSRGNAIAVTNQKHLTNVLADECLPHYQSWERRGNYRLVPCTLHNYWCICQTRQSFRIGFNGRSWFLLPNLGETVADTSSRERSERVNKWPNPLLAR
jgi:hypothetical protein